MVPGVNAVVHQKQLAGGGTEPPEGGGKWVRLAKILVREGADKRTMGRFYVAVVQAVILFGYKTWVLTPRL